jgi:hypothetical protein
MGRGGSGPGARQRGRGVRRRRPLPGDAGRGRPFGDRPRASRGTGRGPGGARAGLCPRWRRRCRGWCSSPIRPTPPVPVWSDAPEPLLQALARLESEARGAERRLWGEARRRLGVARPSDSQDGGPGHPWRCARPPARLATPPGAPAPPARARGTSRERKGRAPPPAPSAVRRPGRAPGHRPGRGADGARSCPRRA